MRVEIAVALNFLTSHLYSKLPRRRVNMLAEEITKQLHGKYQNHWHVDRPSRGSGYRCLKFNLPKIDRVIHNAAREVGLDEREIVDCLPDDLIIWIDPGEVSYRIGERGAVNILYSEDYTRSHDDQSLSSGSKEEFSKNHNAAAARYTSEEDSGCCSSISHQQTDRTDSSAARNSRKPSGGIDSENLHHHSPSSDVSSLLSYGNISVPSSDYESSTGYRSSPLFTTATFAQTKFGSTKLKSSSRRNSRMLPNEFSAYIKRKSQVQQQQHRKSSSGGSGNDLAAFNHYPYHQDYSQSHSGGYSWQPQQQPTQQNSIPSTSEMVNHQFGAADYNRYKPVRPYVRRYTYPNLVYAYESFPPSPGSFYDRCLSGPQEISGTGRPPPLHSCVGPPQYVTPDNYHQDNSLHLNRYATGSYHNGNNNNAAYGLQLLHEQLLGMSASASSLPVGMMPRSLRSRFPAIMIRNDVSLSPYNSNEMQQQFSSAAAYFPPPGPAAAQGMYSLAGANNCGGLISSTAGCGPPTAANSVFHRMTDNRPLSLEPMPTASPHMTVINGACFPSM